MIKIDKFNINDLSMILALKARANAQYDKSGTGKTEGAAYRIYIPKDIMDEDSYYEIPPHLQSIIEKYKQLL